MKIYHGSLEIVKTPKILPRKSGHTCDFGLCFYATTDCDQAERWVKIRMRENKKSGFVNEYSIDDDLLQSENLKILKFDSASESSLDFVVRNRSDVNFTHDYDLVFGKVANDNVYASLNQTAKTAPFDLTTVFKANCLIICHFSLRCKMAFSTFDKVETFSNVEK